MKNIYLKIAAALTLLVIFPMKAFAALPAILPTPKCGDWSCAQIDDVLVVLINVIRILSALAGVVALIYIILGGYNYVTSFGNPETAQKGKATLTWAIVGLIVSLSAYIIMNFIISKII